MKNKVRQLFVWTLLALFACTNSVKPFIAPDVTPLKIMTFPQIAMVYSDMHIICQLPQDSGDGYYTFGIVDQTKSIGPIDRLQYHLYIKIPCEPFRVFCGYNTDGKNNHLVVKDITPVGECRDAR